MFQYEEGAKLPGLAPRQRLAELTGTAGEEFARVVTASKLARAPRGVVAGRATVR